MLRGKRKPVLKEKAKKVFFGKLIINEAV